MNEEREYLENGKDLVVKLDPASRTFAKCILDKANKDEQFKKKLNFKELFEHLLRAYGEKAVPDLIKLREQPEDKLKMLYQQSGTSLEYHDWLVQQVTKRDEVGKRSTKKKGEDVGVN